jgi:N-acetylglucosaminyldiphosphoundecaprenol N-acetyl-beta-D-mannosaminyltransferase
VLVSHREAQYKNKMQVTTHQRVSVLGSLYSVLQQSEVLQFLKEHALLRLGSYVCVSNVHTTMMGFWDSNYQRITNQSLLSVPDGMPITWAMRILGATSQDRVRGPSLMRALCDQGRALGLSHYLFGSTPETLQLLKQKLEFLYPGIKIVGVESPPFRPLSAEENQAVIKRVNASGANFLWVGLGAPKQELWMGQNCTGAGAVAIGIGAAFDLLAERIPEAPELMRNAGLEWLYRFAKEPKRLWRRYLYHNPVFVLFFLLQWLRGLFLNRENSL